MKLYFIKEKITGKFVQSEKYRQLSDIEAAFENGSFKRDRKSAEKTIKAFLKDGTVNKYDFSPWRFEYFVLGDEYKFGYKFSSVKSIAEKRGIEFIPVEWEIVEYHLTLASPEN